VETDAQLITALAVLAGNAPDATGALGLVEQREVATGSAVAEIDGDCAYGDGPTRQAFADAGRTLSAKAPVLPTHGGFPKTAFQIDLDAATGPTCACPGGWTTATRTPCGKGRQVFSFPVAVCAACPVRAQCLREPNRRTTRRTGRTVLLHPQERLLQAARAFQQSPAFVAVRRRRQAAEHRLARLVQLGLRQARFVGRAKTLLQLALAATGANLTRLAVPDRSHPPSQGTFFGSATSALVFIAAVLVLVLAHALTNRGARSRRRRHVACWRHSWPRPVTFRPDF
jgi:hypothetical protein